MKPIYLYLDEALTTGVAENDSDIGRIVPRECLQPRHGHIVASVPPCWENLYRGVTREGLQKGGFGVKVVRRSESRHKSAGLLPSGVRV